MLVLRGLLKYTRSTKTLPGAPRTKAIIDHWGFFVQNGAIDEKSWEQLLSFAEFPQCYVKVSAVFRNVEPEIEWPYLQLDERFVQLKEKFGANRLMWGSDYPFVQQQCKYKKAISCMAEWPLSNKAFSEQDWAFLFRGTAESLFGSWEVEEQDL